MKWLFASISISSLSVRWKSDLRHVSRLICTTVGVVLEGAGSTWAGLTALVEAAGQIFTSTVLPNSATSLEKSLNTVRASGQRSRTGTMTRERIFGIRAVLTFAILPQ